MSISNRIKKMVDYQNASSIGSRFRARRIAPLLQMIKEIHGKQGRVRIIDVGGTKEYWNILAPEVLVSYDVSITVVNPLGSSILRDEGRFTFRHGDGCELSDIQDQSFDIAHSNSVIEHVGDWTQMVRFGAEIRRVATRYFVQTPSFWFPLEPHCMTPFFHWLPVPSRIWLVQHVSLGNWPKCPDVKDAVRMVESARLLNQRMLRAVFPEASLITERFFGMSKSMVAIY